MTGEFENRVAVVRRAKDGDTQELTIRLSPTLNEDIVCRILGFDAPESRRTKCGRCGGYTSPFELVKAAEALNLAIDFLNARGELWNRREMKRDDFGRELVTIWHVIDGIATDLGEALFDAGLATRYPQRWHEVYDPR